LINHNNILNKIDYKSELNEAQLDVVLNGDGPCLVLAGAGSGKTKTLVFRVISLLEKGVDPGNILLLTFTNKAAKEMFSRIEKQLGVGIKGLWGGTFHHIGNRFLRKYGQLINIKPNFNILDDHDSSDMIKAAYKEVGLPADKYFPKPSVVKNIIGIASNLSMPIEDVIRDKYDFVKDEYIWIIEKIKGLYAKKKQFSNSLDFDDLLIKWNQLLYENREFKEAMSKKFKYLLIDEYQDTNKIQSDIIENLSGEASNILAVGDDAQSIYGFRGADIKNILQFPQRFKNCKIFKLETNYRSTPEILHLANSCIKNNEGKFDKSLKSIKDQSIKPTLSALISPKEEAKYICQKVLDLQSKNGLALSEVAILFRSHYQSIEIELQLNKKNIPYEMRGGMRFFEQAHIKDLLAYLRIISNFKDEMAWTRILLMLPSIGMATANKIWQRISTFNSVSDFCNDDFSNISSKSQIFVKGLQKNIKKIIEIDENNLPLILTAIFEDYQDYLKSNYENANERIEDIEQLIDFSRQYSSMTQFLSDAVLSEGFGGQRGTENGSDNEEAVVLSTIHQAKGLEWKAVFVVGLNEMQFPHAKSTLKNQDLEEERRLFYVAVTRAKEYLFLTYSLFASDDNLNQPSRFITELPKDSYLRIDDDDDEEVIYLDENGEENQPRKRYLDFQI